MSIDSETEFYTQLERLEGHFFNGNYNEAPRKMNRDPICGACGCTVLGNDVVHIPEQTFHDSCFRCQNCGFDLSHLNADVEPQRLTAQNGHIDRKVESPKKTNNITGKLQCSKLCENKELQLEQENGRLCSVCGTRVLPKQCLEMPSGVIHRECFRCKRCGTLLDIHTFRLKSGELYCEDSCPENPEAFQPNGTLSIDSLQNYPFLKFVPVNQPFLSEVVRPMNGTYNCKRCRKACLPHELVERAGSFYHRNCVRCAVCNQLVSISDRWWINGTPHCEKHFMQRYHNDALKAKAYMHPNRHPVFIHNSKPLMGVSKEIPNESHFNPTTGKVVTSAVIRPHVIPLGMQSPNASSQSTIDESGNSPPGRIPRSQSYDHISHQRTKPVSNNLHHSRVIIEYQCHVCGAIIPAGQCLTYASQIYHESCARCKVCRAGSREEKLFLHHKELYCGLHLGDIKRNEISQLPNSYVTHSSEPSLHSPKHKFERMQPVPQLFERLDSKRASGLKRVELVVRPTSTWDINHKPVFTPQTSVWPKRGILRNSK
ncbi:cysteine and glycine-rich protein, partial [Clonorchis sinensis]